MIESTPPPHPGVSHRPASAKAAPTFTDAAHRRRFASAFSSGADVYDDVRPSYPPEVLDLLGDAGTVVDIGAGTGKLTELLMGTDRTVYALDPSRDMVTILRDKLGIPVWQATAEATALADNSVDAAVSAQTWHWVDTDQASAELDRIVRPGGTVVLVWNTLDVSDPWVLRLSRIMHSGDIHKPGFVPEVAAPWVVDTDLRVTWSERLTPQQVHQLAHTRSYWLRSNDTTRQRVTDNLNWYLTQHTGLQPTDEVIVPYRTDAFLLRRDNAL